jgi:ParB-like chromosome segregation protein Spo0J
VTQEVGMIRTGETELLAPEDLTPHPRNARHGDVDAIAASIRANGFYGRVYGQRSTGYVLVGNHRVRAAARLGLDAIPVEWLDVDDETALRILLADNRSSDLATYQDDQLAELLEEVKAAAGTLDGTGYADDDLDRLLDDLRTADEQAGGAAGAGPTDSLAERFGAPPFSVLDTRQGYWQQRKRAWIALGIESELGRDAVDGETVQHLRPQPGKGGSSASRRMSDKYAGGDVWATSSRRSIADSVTNVTGAPDLPEWATNGLSRVAPGTSIFDPVLTELMIRWYSPPDGHVLDPFAGGSVRGLVTSSLGRAYTGIDLRPEQVAANEQQWLDVGPRLTPGPKPAWQVGDSLELLPTLDDLEADLLLTCPPYGNLEVYSDDPADLSTMSPDAFEETYRAILEHSARHLRPDRFAVLIVSEYRLPDGTYAGLVPLTIDAMRAAGLRLYNEAILVNAIGTLALRISRQFTAGRKLGRTHQNVLIFVKGDPRRAADACGSAEDSITLPDLEPEPGAELDAAEYTFQLRDA